MATSTRTRRPRHRLRWLGLGLVVVVAVVAAGLWWFFRGDAPAAVDLNATAQAVNQQEGATASTAAARTGIEGNWTVDTTVGTFTASGDATSTFAGFRVAEVLSGIGSTTAVGRSPKVSGTATIAGQQVTAADLSVDLTAIRSNEPRREGAIQEALHTARNPDATFRLTKPIALGPEAASGQQVSVTATGDLTVNGTTKPVDIPLQAKLVDGRILVTGALPITFADYGVSVPRSPVVVSVEDHGTLELQLWLSAG